MEQTAYIRACAEKKNLNLDKFKAQLQKEMTSDVKKKEEEGICHLNAFVMLCNGVNFIHGHPYPSKLDFIPISYMYFVICHRCYFQGGTATVTLLVFGPFWTYVFLSEIVGNYHFRLIL